MDEIERRLLSAIRENSRTSLLSLAKQLNVPAATVHNKVKRHQGKLIQKCTALLDFTKLGYTRAWLAIKTTPEGRSNLSGHLENHTAINNLHKINSGFDFLAEIIAKDVKEIEDFTTKLRAMPEVLMIHKYVIICDLKREEFIL